MEFPIDFIPKRLRLKKSSTTLKQRVSDENNSSESEGAELDPWEVDDSEAPSATGDTKAGAWELPKRKRVPPDRFGAPVVHYHYITSKVFPC